MTKHEAHMKAHALWANSDRYGAVCLRQKASADRYEVGYQTRAAAAPMVVMGRGPSWEEAFASAAEGSV